MTATSFAHISDPHLPLAARLPRPLTELASKRLLGYLSWRLRRSRHHRADALDAIIRDIRARVPDHLLVTGDLVNIALPGEFAAARLWLESLGPASAVSVVPGNHELTVPLPWASSLGLWSPWMTGDDAKDSDAVERFPYIRRRGQIAFVNLSTAVASAPFLAIGRLGQAQIERAGRALAELRRDGLFRVVAIHHPPVAGVVGARKRLVDLDAFKSMLWAEGAELVVHGHCHHSHFAHLKGPGGPVPVVGVPSASASPGEDNSPARWHLFRVSREGDTWSLSLTVRGLRADSTCETEGGWTMVVPGRPALDAQRSSQLLSGADRRAISA